MHIENDKLIGTNVAHPKGQTQFGGRITPTVIVIHETASPVSLGHSTRFITSGGGRKKASYHAVYEYEKRLVQHLVDFDRKAHHAGPSKFNGRSGVNGFSIGLSIASPGKMKRVGKRCHLFYGPKSVASFPVEDCVQKSTRKRGNMGWWLPYKDHQLSDLKETCRLLIAKYPTIKEITTHELIDNRGWKTDAGPLFPLDEWRVELFAGNKVSDGMLRKGDEGRAVERAQIHLIALGYWVGDTDTRFGDLMEEKVMSFQKQNGLNVDGVIGPKTWAALESIDAKEFPTGAREEGGKEAFAKIGSKTKETGDAAEIAGGAIIVTNTLWPMVNNASEFAQKWQEPLESIKGFGDFLTTGLVPFVFSSWRVLAAIAIGMFLFAGGRYLKNLRFKDWVTGKHVGK